MSARDDLLGLARGVGATIVENGGTLVIVVPADDAGDDLLPLARAAEHAATSPRVLKDAIRAGELIAFGRERDRSVRRGDLDAWISNRRVKVDIGLDDDRIDARVRRLEKKRGAA